MTVHRLYGPRFKVAVWRRIELQLLETEPTQTKMEDSNLVGRTCMPTHTKVYTGQLMDAKFFLMSSSRKIPNSNRTAKFTCGRDRLSSR
jgi:hypothetical protein